MATPGPPSSATAAASASAPRAVTHTFAPCRTSSVAIPRPMPRLAPVTMATRFCSASICLFPAVRPVNGRPYQERAAARSRRGTGRGGGGGGGGRGGGGEGGGGGGRGGGGGGRGGGGAGQERPGRPLLR